MHLQRMNGCAFGTVFLSYISVDSLLVEDLLVLGKEKGLMRSEYNADLQESGRAGLITPELRRSKRTKLMTSPSQPVLQVQEAHEKLQGRNIQDSLLDEVAASIIADTGLQGTSQILDQPWEKCCDWDLYLLESSRYAVVEISVSQQCPMDP